MLIQCFPSVMSAPVFALACVETWSRAVRGRSSCVAVQHGAVSACGRLFSNSGVL